MLLLIDFLGPKQVLQQVGAVIWDWVQGIILFHRLTAEDFHSPLCSMLAGLLSNLCRGKSCYSHPSVLVIKLHNRSWPSLAIKCFLVWRLRKRLLFHLWGIFGCCRLSFGSRKFQVRLQLALVTCLRWFLAVFIFRGLFRPVSLRLLPVGLRVMRGPQNVCICPAEFIALITLRIIWFWWIQHSGVES